MMTHVYNFAEEYRKFQTASEIISEMEKGRWKMKVLVLVLPLMSLAHEAPGQEDGEMWRNVMILTGAVSAEELDEEVVVRFKTLKDRPVDINTASRSRLVSTGLFSQYQVASLCDYRSRNGDILSISELAALDGFGKDFAEALVPFIRLGAYVAPGRSSAAANRVYNDLTLRSGVKHVLRTEDIPPETSYSYAMKYGLSWGEAAEAGVACRQSYDAAMHLPEASSFYVALYGRRPAGKVVLGDFNARFGQGLVLWSGFSMSGLSSPESFSRRPSGISPYRSYSGEGCHRGIAADIGIGHFIISAFASAPALKDIMAGKRDVPFKVVPGINAAWYGMNGQVSFTCYAESMESVVMTGAGGSPQPDDVQETGMSGRRFMDHIMMSADVRYNIKGIDVFSEVAFDPMERVPAALAGSRFRICDALDMAMNLRYYPAEYKAEYAGAVRSGSKCTNEYGISVSGNFRSGTWVALAGKTGFGSSVIKHGGTFSADVAYCPEPKYGVHTSSLQSKISLSYTCQVSPSVAIAFKASERFRTYGTGYVTDLRCDIKYSCGKAMASMRMNAKYGTGLAVLSYIEGGYKESIYSCYLRCGVFKADNWDDRIYVYERDAPGNFSVPAYYGRGFWSALSAGVKFSGWGRLYLRAALTGYPWLSPGSEKKKPGKSELKIQLVFDI